jgi:L-asparaginase / beta-aspartyl-peptidase
MLKTILMMLVCLVHTMLATAAVPCGAQKHFALVVHGGTMDYVGQETSERVAFLRTVLLEGRARLADGGASLDVVEEMVRQMENAGIFNAGRGGKVNAKGFVELDAGIMDGISLRYGAIASATRLKNPVSAARLILEHSPHVLMVGDRGQDYAIELGAESIDPREYFMHRAPIGGEPPHGTVGAVALDKCGNIAAATSTGGFGAKVPGRVGDSPIVGAGVLADNQVGGFSATGHGEYFLRYSVAKDVADRMAYGRQSIDEAARAVIVDRLGALKIEAGLIGIDPRGHVTMQFDQIGMFRGYVTDTGPVWAGAK